MHATSAEGNPPNGFPILHSPFDSSTCISDDFKEQDTEVEDDKVNLFHQHLLDHDEDGEDNENADFMNCQPFYCLTFSEGQLLLLLLVAMFVIGVLVALVVIMKYDTPVCDTATCVHEAALHLSHMNLSEDPCNRFYQYACRSADQSKRWNTLWKTPQFYLSSRRILERVRRLLQGPVQNNVIAGRQSSAVNLTRNFLQSCTDLENRYEVGRSSVEDMVARLGGWKVVGRNFTLTADPFTYLLGQALRYGGTPLLKVSVEINPFNTKVYSLILSSPVTIIPPEVLRRNVDSHRLAFRDLFIGIAEMLKVNNVTSTSLAFIADQIWYFERKLVKLKDEYEKENDLNALNQYSMSTVADVSEMYKDNWNIRNLLRILYNDTDIPDAETVILESQNLLKAINSEVKNMDQSVKESYIVAHTIYRFSTVHGFHLQSLKYRFKTIIGSSALYRDLTDECMQLTDRLFPTVINAIYTNSYISRSSILESTFLANRIKRAIQTHIKNSKWMDDVTRKIALQKLERITVSVARPLKEKGVQELDNYFADLLGMVDDKSVYTNYLFIRDFQRKKERSIMMEAVNVINYVRTLARVDALFIQPLLHLEVRSRLLQYPFFHEDFAEAFNYGGLGTVLAHELSDSFYEDGRFMDPDGILRSWWSESTSHNFKNMQQCFTQQYYNSSSLQLTELPGSSGVDLSLQQRLGDALGLHIAYDAFSHYHLAKSMQAVRLPGMKTITMDQLFFITAAQKHCAYYAKRHAGESYSAAERRVLLVMSNSPAFARAFHCKAGDRYNTLPRCSLS